MQIPDTFCFAGEKAPAGWGRRKNGRYGRIRERKEERKEPYICCLYGKGEVVAWSGNKANSQLAVFYSTWLHPSSCK